MSFLSCTPSVFVIEKEYEILVNTKTNGICWVEVGGEKYYEDTSGVLSSEKNHTKIRVPQGALNEAKKYAVVFRETINRKGYFSLMGEPQTVEFNFKPLEKTENIHIYHIADVHYGFETAAKAARYFGDDTDLFLVNGDIGEVETAENYLETSAFVGEISKGEIPVLFARGNHDTRGHLAEKYTEYFPSNGQKTYFTFEIGCLKGVVLDLGEDKRDEHYDEQYPNPWVYGGVNAFHQYRQKELQWLKKVELEEDGKITFAMSHICPVQASVRAGSDFDIERECYQAMSDELERLNIRFMICGHIHNAYLLQPNDERSLLKHDYPVVVGSKLYKEKYAPGGRVTVEKYYGAAFTVNKDEIEVVFADQNFEVLEKHVIK